MAIDSSNINPKVPKHLGIILDGNRRWAKERGLPPFEGHRAGKDNLKKITEAAIERGIRYISVYVFSTENWKRPKEEVNYLMKLLLIVATKEVGEMHAKNIRIRFLGSREGLSEKILTAIDRAEELTKDNTRGTLALCLNYGGQQEIADAVKSLMADGVQAAQVTPEVIADYLYGADIPPIDLMIRTSGEQRISNFMLWRMAYAEMLFVTKHWPDFKASDLDDALADFGGRERRFGGDAKAAAGSAEAPAAS